MGVINGNLPDGWTWTTIGNVADTTSGGTPLRSHPEYYGGNIPWLKSGELRDGIIRDAEETITDAGLKNSSAKYFSKDTVVVALYGATVGRTGILGFDATTNQAICGISPRNNSFFSKYMFYWLQSQRQNLVNQSAGGAQPNISQGIIRNLPFPLSPLPEQKRIVAKIEELFTQLEAGTAALKRVRAGLKRHKASVLKAAVEGRLLPVGGDEGRMQNDGDLPDGWRWTTIGELAQHLTSGSRGWASYYSDEGSLFVRVGNFNRLSKTIDLNKKQFVNAPQTAEANRTRLKKRDLLITMTADVGMVGIVDVNTLRWGDAYINQHVGLVRLKDSDFVEYVAYALASEYGQKQFREKQYGLTKVGLNFDDIRSLKIPLPPLAEQRRIVAEVERRLSVAQEVESVVAASVARAGRLRQSVLKSAFEGRFK